MSPNVEITELLHAWRNGDDQAIQLLMSRLYPSLRSLAGAEMARERGEHTLQPTALVNEAFLRLMKVHEVDWQDRGHFLAISARIMRQVLVDSARARGYQKRGSGIPNGPLDGAEPASTVDLQDSLVIHMALDALEKHDSRKAQVVELRFFGGLSVEEVSEVLCISQETVNRDWRYSKAWLLRHLMEGVQIE